MLIFVQMPPILAKKEKTIKKPIKKLIFPLPKPKSDEIRKKRF